MDAATRNRIEAIGRSLNRRVLTPLSAWQNMLRALTEPPPEPGSRPDHILFLRLDRAWRAAARSMSGCTATGSIPTIPFAATLAAPAQGLLVTSATLRDAGDARPGDAPGSRPRHASARRICRRRRSAPRSPARSTTPPRPAPSSSPTCSAATSPQLAAAYRALFMAAGGGALGLFTAIRRLQAVHARIAPELEAAGIPLYAQHVDAMGNATLVDIFRTEEESCLLGTDAMRDGVDVPGRALRLVVFEKVPWPRPDILHRERRIHLSDGDPKAYDDRIARLRLRQAFGRLIRRATDRGVFVLLDRQTPSRLLSAFPGRCRDPARRPGRGGQTDARLPAASRCPLELSQLVRSGSRHRQAWSSAMRARDALDAPEALVLTMVLVAAADGGMTDREIGVMAGQVQTLPAFHDFTTEQFSTVTDAAVQAAERGGRLAACRAPDARRTGAAAARDRLCAGLRSGRGEPGGKQRTLEMLELRPRGAAARPADRRRDRTRRARPPPARRAGATLAACARCGRPSGGRRRGAGARTGCSGATGLGADRAGIAGDRCDAARGVAARAALVARSRSAGGQRAPGRRGRTDAAAVLRCCRACSVSAASSSGWRGASAARSALIEQLRRADGTVVERLPDPLIVLAEDRSVRRANSAARAAFGADMPAVLRHPDLRAAIDRAFASGDAADRRGDAAGAGAARGACRRGADGPADRRWRPRRRGAVRSHARARGRAHARRLRRQCQPRAAHAARVADRLHRDVARAGGR